MSEEKFSSRSPFATILAAAAVTVAVGVTAAALGGYIVPVGDQQTPTAAVPPNVESANPTEPQPIAASNAANVVLVPVAPDVVAASPVAAEPEPWLADPAPRERETHRGRSHGDEEDHEGGDEHDDD